MSKHDDKVDSFSAVFPAFEVFKTMGMRSDICIAMSKEAFIKYEMLAGELPEILKIHHKSETNDNYYWGFHSVKWHSFSNPRVQDLMNFIETVTHDNEKEMAFIRIGEEFDDVESYGDTEWFDMYINTEITCPAGNLKDIDKDA